MKFGHTKVVDNGRMDVFEEKKLLENPEFPNMIYPKYDDNASAKSHDLVEGYKLSLTETKRLSAYKQMLWTTRFLRENVTVVQKLTTTQEIFEKIIARATWMQPTPLKGGFCDGFKINAVRRKTDS